MTRLETARLILRPWIEQDAEALFAAFGDPEAMRYWNTPPAAGIDAIRDDIRRSLAIGPDSHAGWAVAMKPAGAVVGFVNYHHRDIAARRLEIGYIMVRSVWRQGLAREAVAALVDHCVTAGLAERIEAIVDPANRSSVRLLERLGFRAEEPRQAFPPSAAEDGVRFALLAPAWHRPDHS